MKKRLLLVALALVVGAGAVALAKLRPAVRYVCVDRILKPDPPPATLIPYPHTTAEKVVNVAKQEVIRGVRYSAEYVSIPYPNGDVPSSQGACTDVVIRALRAAGYDLQKLVHEDMKRHFNLYPGKWRLTRPDPNIDHRRVPNLMVFFKRFAAVLPVETGGRHAESWQAGDIVCWELNGNGLKHIGIVSDQRNGEGLPLVIHNIGPSASQEDCLTQWRIVGHFRYPR